MRHWHLGGWILLLLYGAVVIWLFPHRDWDPDEFEHLQASWLISEGLTPYRDFFEHHTPLWHLLTSLTFRLVQLDSTDAVAMILALFRAFSFLCSAAVAALTWLLARKLVGPSAASIALILLLSESTFMLKGIEIRPDPLSTLGIVGAAYALVQALTPQARGLGSTSWPFRSAALWTAMSGAAGMLAVLSSQKALFALPGLGAAFAYGAIRTLGWRGTGSLVGWGLAGAAVAAAPVLIWFTLRGALGAFWYYNFLLNSGWQRSSFSWDLLALRYDGIFFMLMLLGAMVLVWRAFRPDRQPLLLFVVLPLLSLVVGGAFLPVVQKQYIFMLLPFAAVCGSIAIQNLLQAMKSKWVMPIGIAVLLVMVLLSTARNLELSFYRRDAETRAKLAFLLRTVPFDGAVLGSWSPGIAFRRPAWFYFFLHGEIQSMIPAEAYQKLADDLHTGAIRPALVDFDHFMADLPPGVVAEIKHLYRPTGVADLQRRLDDAP